MCVCDFFIWDDFIEPKKEYQCPNYGLLLDEPTLKWSDESDSFVFICPAYIKGKSAIRAAREFQRRARNFPS